MAKPNKKLRWSNLFSPFELIDKKTRDKAVKALGRWISNKKDFSHLELMKLWKGLFYCKQLSRGQQDKDTNSGGRND
jgi:hypothetical protein